MLHPNFDFFHFPWNRWTLKSNVPLTVLPPGETCSHNQYSKAFMFTDCYTGRHAYFVHQNCDSLIQSFFVALLGSPRIMGLHPSSDARTCSEHTKSNRLNPSQRAGIIRLPCRTKLLPKLTCFDPKHIAPIFQLELAQIIPALWNKKRSGFQSPLISSCTFHPLFFHHSRRLMNVVQTLQASLETAIYFVPCNSVVVPWTLSQRFLFREYGSYDSKDSMCEN